MIGGIIQARTGSSRLPEKILMNLDGVSVLEHLVKQVRISKRLQNIVLATSNLERDNKLADHARSIGLNVYRGDEQKIMTRLLGAAEQYGITVIVRLLGDCPLSDPEMIDAYVAELENNSGLDMVTNQHPHTYPDGYDISVIRVESLRRLCRNFDQSGEAEHMSGFWKEGSGFTVKNMTAEEDYFARFRMTLDYPKDLDAIQMVVKSLNGGKRVLYLRDVLNYLETHPETAAINKEYIE